MTTPVRRQYLRIKKEHQDDVLLFRMGDFYETFDDDARTVSRELEIALTSREMGRGQRVPLAGIPYHALEPYLARLIRKGYRVAICEQVSDPATSKGLVDREVVRVVTPGTIIEDSLLDQKANSYLASVLIEGDQVGLAYVDITTSEFAASQFPSAHLSMEISRLAPSELLVPEAYDGPLGEEGTTTTEAGADAFHMEWSRETLLSHFGVVSLEAYGCEHLPLATRAAGAIIDYLGRNQRGALGQITSLHTYSTSEYMVMDPQTRRNLELFEGRQMGGDEYVSAVGGRPHRDAYGRSPSEAVDRPAPPGPSPADETTRRRGMVSSQLAQEGAGGGVPRDCLGYRAPDESSPWLQCDA